MSQVRDVMRTAFPMLRSGTPLRQAISAMGKMKARVIPVCENGKFIGVVDENDLLKHGASDEKIGRRAKVKSLVNRSYPKIPPGVNVYQAARVMAERSVDVLPVVQNGRLVGVLTASDLARMSPVLAFLVRKWRSRDGDPINHVSCQVSPGTGRVSER